MSDQLPVNDDWGALGPAMRALPNPRWRAFVEFYLLETTANGRKNNYGSQANAARKAGFGEPKTTAHSMAHIGWRLMRDDRVIAAIAEESRKIVRAGAPEAAKALLNLVRDSSHKDHARGIAMLMARTDPEVQLHDMQVTHRIADPDEEAIEELRAARALGATREKLMELFGGNYLPRLERMEAAELERRAANAKTIDVEAT
jgi:hypothetical protein